MLRFFSAGALLLTIASSVSAGERYVEIWNPPEARIGAATGKCAPKTHGAAAGATIGAKIPSRNPGKVVPRRVADPLSRSAPGKKTPVGVVKKPAIPPSLYIPRVITPEGNVLRV